MSEKEGFVTGVERIAAERQRQIDREGYTPEHDDRHSVVELWDAACAYAFTDPSAWPWEPEGFKPISRVRDLEKSGALFAAVRDFAQRRIDVAAAEIDRLQAASGEASDG